MHARDTIVISSTLPQDQPYATSDTRQKVVPRTAQRLLLALLAVVFCGGFLFLVTISPLLLYGFYIALAALIVLRIESVGQFLKLLAPISPYLYWLLIYGAWATLVSPFISVVFGDIVRLMFRNLLFLTAAAVAFSDAQNFQRFARFIQIGVIINCAISVTQLNDPQFALDLARMLGEKTYTNNNVRPGGLWINPDEAAFANLMALLIIGTERTPLAWIARCAAVYSIYVSASRTGSYILLIFFLAFLAFQLSQRAFSFKRMTILVNVLAVAYLIFLGLYYTDNLPTYDHSQDFALSRILDVQESNTDYTRGDLTYAVFQVALNAPWHGYGTLGLQDADASQLYFQRALPGLGAHNIFLAIWGEAGILGLFGYLIALGVGASRVLRAKLAPTHRLIAGLMWMAYLIRGLTWHGQLTSGMGILCVAALYCYPVLMELRDDRPLTTDDGLTAVSGRSSVVKTYG
jgi:O-antigen ligase